VILLNPFVLGSGGGGGGIGAHRYWRIVNVTVPASDFLEIAEVQLLTGVTVVSEGKTYASNPVPDSVGALSLLFDGDLSTRVYWTAAHAEDPSFYLSVDLGSDTAVDGVKQAGFDNNSRYMDGFTLQYSDDNSSWTTATTKSGLTYPGNNTLSATYSIP
jgi:hypothetical protein